MADLDSIEVNDRELGHGSTKLRVPRGYGDNNVGHRHCSCSESLINTGRPDYADRDMHPKPL
jgi:hypothetical protein